jgi:hypothetical protein
MAWVAKEAAMQAADRGAADWGAGLPISANPYDEHWAADAWIRGWQCAARTGGANTVRDDPFMEHAQDIARRQGGQPNGGSGIGLRRHNLKRDQGLEDWSYILLFMALLAVGLCIAAAMG